MSSPRETAYPDEPEDVKQARIAAARFCRGKDNVHPEEILGLAWIAHQKNLAKCLKGHALHTANAREIIDLLRAEDNRRRKYGHLQPHTNTRFEREILDPHAPQEPDEAQETWASFSRQFAPDASWRVRVALYLVLVEEFRVQDAAEVVGYGAENVWAYLRKFRAKAQRCLDL